MAIDGAGTGRPRANSRRAACPGELTGRALPAAWIRGAGGAVLVPPTPGTAPARTPVPPPVTPGSAPAVTPVTPGAAPAAMPVTVLVTAGSVLPVSPVTVPVTAGACPPQGR